MSDDVPPPTPFQCTCRVMPEKLGGVCELLPKSFTLFKTKLYDFLHPICDEIKNLSPARTYRVHNQVVMYNKV